VVAHLAQSCNSLSLTGPLAAPMNLAQLEVRWQCSLHHVSLGVEVLDIEITPLLATVTCVNGLVFFKQSEQTAMIVKWPRVWTEGN
jgi:hypothetical protein